MDIAKLEAILLSLGFRPVEGDRSVTSRAWKHQADERNPPALVRVPRTHWIPRMAAMAIIRRAQNWTTAR
jgi:hypothetical protein